MVISKRKDFKNFPKENICVESTRDVKPSRPEINIEKDPFKENICHKKIEKESPSFRKIQITSFKSNKETKSQIKIFGVLQHLPP